MCKYIHGFVPLVLVLTLGLGWAEVHQFSFDLHHRFSDVVRSIMPFDHPLPEKGTVDYYAALVHRDRIHGRRLTGSTIDQTPLTFVAGNATFQIGAFGFLYYANVSVGTPGLDFLVALDTGSNLFWLPCDCTSCVKGVRLQTQQGVEELLFNMYSLNTSSTGTRVPCSSSVCQLVTSCPSTSSECPYEIDYLSANTSSIGYLVEDVLQLTTDVNPLKPVNAKITLGCGKVQTGSFLKGGAPNGLFGLGIDNTSVPSILASQNVAANSFSMCFGGDVIGRISFGDKGSLTQSETPFNLRPRHPTYNISITQITVGNNVTDINITAIFDSGTSFTILNDPAYSLITESFNAQVKEQRATVDPSFAFEFCYALSSCKSKFEPPIINLTMKGGAQFFINGSIEVIQSESGCAYCLAVAKSDTVNIIAENFMTGYRIVFDREKMVLGWEASDCSYTYDTTTSLPISPHSSAAVPSSVGTEATTAASNNDSHLSGAASTFGHYSHLKSWTGAVLVVCLQFLLIL
ncbi:hypothetical protein Ancab_003131 [Ancistrocladus abbreviatus]